MNRERLRLPVGRDKAAGSDGGQRLVHGGWLTAAIQPGPQLRPYGIEDEPLAVAFVQAAQEPERITLRRFECLRGSTGPGSKDVQVVPGRGAGLRAGEEPGWQAALLLPCLATGLDECG